MVIWFLLALLPSMRADPSYLLSAPETFILFSGGIEVDYRIPSPDPGLRLLLVLVSENEEKPVAKRDIPLKVSKGKIAFLCNLFERAGRYVFKLVTTKEDKELARTKSIDVRWPDITIHVPLMVETYSSDVSVELYVHGLKCKPRGSYTTYIDLVYEGMSSSTWLDPTTLTSKELIGWMWNESFETTLECEFFDRAGNYTVRVRTNIADADIISVSDTILVMWSHRYSVSIAKSSVQPCDGSLSVIYHYPRCILDQDRIRVYGKALRGPMKYIRESRVESGKHSTKLSCDIFQDDFYEYCFSFVSTARNGAVFDLKTHCLPTAVDESLSAAWNEWGPWSECSSTCGSGVQSRYRLCLSARNNSYCLGKAVQSQPCSLGICEDTTSTTIEETTEWECSCGCERNLTAPLLTKLSVSNCDSSVWWVIQAWPSGHVIIEIAKLVFPSSDCWVTIRDGKSSLGVVLAVIGPDTNHHPVHSLSDIVRLEVHCGNTTNFEATEIVCRLLKSEIPRASLAIVREKVDIEDSSNLSAVHVTIIMLAAVLCSTTAFLILVHLYRKYKPKSFSTSSNMDCPELLTSTSEISEKTPSASPEDYLYKSFIFRSSTSLQPKLRWDKLPVKVDPSDTSSPVRRRSRPTNKGPVQRESTTPLAASVSELSMSASEDGFEYDYYDYGCHQEPGSFFCPDPVLMGWPPFIPLPPQGTEEFGDYPLQHFTPSPDHSPK